MDSIQSLIDSVKSFFKLYFHPVQAFFKSFLNSVQPSSDLFQSGIEGVIHGRYLCGKCSQSGGVLYLVY